MSQTKKVKKSIGILFAIITSIITLSSKAQTITNTVLSNDGQYMVSYNYLGPLYISQVKDSKLIKSFNKIKPNQVATVLFTPDNKKLIIELLWEGIYVYDIATGEWTNLVKVKTLVYVDLHIDAETNTLIICKDKKILFYDLQDIKLKKDMKGPHNSSDIAYIDKKYLVTLSQSPSDPYYLIWDLEKNTFLFKISWQKVDPTGKSFMPDFNHAITLLPKKGIVIASYDNGDIGIWDIATKSETSLLNNPHRSNNIHLTASPAETFFVSTGDDRNLIVWSVDRLEIIYKERQITEVTKSFMSDNFNIKYISNNKMQELTIDINPDNPKALLTVQKVPKDFKGEFVRYYKKNDVYLTMSDNAVYIYDNKSNTLINSLYY